MIDKIKEIFNAYATMINPTEEEEKIAKIRLEVCVSCEFWKEAMGVSYCEKCGCATSAKIFSPKGADACPEKKWPV